MKTKLKIHWGRIAGVLFMGALFGAMGIWALNSWLG